MTARPVIEIEYKGTKRSIGNWAKLVGVSYDRINDRRVRGFTPAQCLGFEPIPRRRNKMPDMTLKRTGKPAEELKPSTMMVEVIDSDAVRKEAKRIRRSCGVTQKEAAKDMGMKSYRLLESGLMKWNEARIAKFNRVAKTWVVASEETREA